MSWLFASGGQNIGASTSASVLPLFTEESSPIVMDSDLLLIVSWVLKKFQSSSSSVGVPIPILPCLLPPRPFLV